MVFSSLTFLCAFLPAVLILYLICPAGYRNLLLLFASLLFYAWGEPRYLLVLLFSTGFDYVNGRLIEAFLNQGKKRAGQIVLFLSVAGNLGILCFFKYTDFLIRIWNALTASEVDVLGIALPIGISFYTFQTMSYTIDVYRGKAKAQRNFISFAMYVSMFPQLIAGPIVRYCWVEDQLAKRKLTAEGVAAGMQRFCVGLAKKVILANRFGALWEELSGGTLSNLSTAGAWLGALAYTLQIYFDFSGYSDMAIGLGRMFGFALPENFRYPYESESITEFWRRWHMTLSAWFREYVYFPLGGNKKGFKRQIFNLFVVWFLTGLWHGASWNFVLWGLYFFVVLLLEKCFLLKEMAHWPKIFRHLYAIVLIMIGWVFFAIEDFGKMGQYLQIMFGIQNGLFDRTVLYYLQSYGALLVIAAVAATQLPMRLLRKVRRYMRRTETEFAAKKGGEVEYAVYGIYTVLLLLVSLAFLVGDSYNPFLYFRF